MPTEKRLPINGENGIWRLELPALEAGATHVYFEIQKGADRALMTSHEGVFSFTRGWLNPRKETK